MFTIDLYIYILLLEAQTSLQFHTSAPWKISGWLRPESPGEFLMLASGAGTSPERQEKDLSPA